MRFSGFALSRPLLAVAAWTAIIPHRARCDEAAPGRVTFSFSAFSSFSHFMLDLTSCLLVNLRLKMESSSFSPPMPGRWDQANPTVTVPCAPPQVLYLFWRKSDATKEATQLQC